jgi:hypothetical protein
VINKQNEDIKLSPQEQKDDGIVDVAQMDVQVHILIKDTDTGESLVNQRG